MSPQEHSPTPAAGTPRPTLTDGADWDSSSQPPCGWGGLLRPPNTQVPAVLSLETRCDTHKTSQDSPGPAVADLLSFHPWRHTLVPGPQATSPTHGLFSPQLCFTSAYTLAHARSTRWHHHRHTVPCDLRSQPSHQHPATGTMDTDGALSWGQTLVAGTQAPHTHTRVQTHTERMLFSQEKS